MTRPKNPPARDECYKRLIAQMPCFSCGIEGYTQVAHSNLGRHGKGRGLKASDYCTFPLCCDRPGVVGCHTLFDQGRILTKMERESHTDWWIAKAQERAMKAGYSIPEKERHG